MTRKEREDDEEGFRHVRVGEHPLEGCTRTSPEPALSKVEWARMTMVGIGGARSDANEANDMQKLVFVYLSRRASHLCKPGMTRKEHEDEKKGPFGERAGWKTV